MTAAAAAAAAAVQRRETLTTFSYALAPPSCAAPRPSAAATTKCQFLRKSGELSGQPAGPMPDRRSIGKKLIVCPGNRQ